MSKVDRTHEYSKPDNEIIVTLDCGFEVRFFATGLSDSEYIERAKAIKELERFIQ